MMAKDYERIYQRDGLYWGEEPSELVKRFAELAPQGKALDLGMGEGRDALYLASVGFDVTGVESTDSGVLKCERLAEQRRVSVRAVCEDVRDYRIAKNRYALIAAINLFQFMKKDEAEDVIARVVDGLKRGGLFVCTTFTQDDPSYKVRKQKSKEVAPGVFLDASGNYYSLYHYGELLKLCSELRPIYYAEYDYYDTQHGPPHWHGVADIVGKKM
jgi:cyclopropane fatty-acyl-phospholipid synthase-like methyltransferase